MILKNLSNLLKRAQKERMPLKELAKYLKEDKFIALSILFKGNQID